MKQFLAALTIIIFSQGALASPTMIGEMKDIYSIVMNIDNVLTCYQTDTNDDGKVDTSVLTLNQTQVGFLNKGIIRNHITEPNGATCTIMQLILQNSHRNFGAIQVIANSQLYLLRGGEILERIDLVIQNMNAGEDSPKLQLSTVVSMPLQQQGE